MIDGKYEDTMYSVVRNVPYRTDLGLGWGLVYFNRLLVDARCPVQEEGQGMSFVLSLTPLASWRARFKKT